MKAEQPAPAVSSMPGMPKNVLLDWFVTKTMERTPSERFQNAREMLEHWWNVMASLDEEGATDVMRGIGRVDESYAGPLRRSMRDAQVIDPGREGHVGPMQTFEAVEEDRTLRRAPGSNPNPPTSAATFVGVAPSTNPGTSPGVPPSVGERTIHDTPPNTERNGASSVGGRHADTMSDDPFDMPTRSDPNLRKLVERELDLQRKRKGGKP
jgi:hypothetical protein